MEGYCVKCKSATTIKDGENKVAKNGAPVHQGTCEACGTKVTKFLPRS